MSAAVDVVVDNLRPGVLEKFGLGVGDVLARNPRVVYCQVSGFGRTGPSAGRPAYDHVVQAATGMTMLGGIEGNPPVKVGFPVIDAAAALLAAFAILAALRERGRTDRAILLDVSMSGAAMPLMYTMTCDALTRGTSPPRVGNKGFSGSPAADLFETRDGWIAIGANKPAHVIAVLVELGLEAMIADKTIFPQGLGSEGKATFATAADPAKLGEALRSAIKSQTADALEACLFARKVPVARLRRLHEFTDLTKTYAPESLAILGQGDEQVISPGLGFGVSFP